MQDGVLAESASSYKGDIRLSATPSVLKQSRETRADTNPEVRHEASMEATNSSPRYGVTPNPVIIKNVRPIMAEKADSGSGDPPSRERPMEPDASRVASGMKGYSPKLSLLSSSNAATFVRSLG